jgi:Ca2+-binding RTX toxin-like protein
MAVITGTNGDDELEGTEFDDEIYGLDGTDTIWGKGGDDLIDPGAGGYRDEEDSEVREFVDAGSGDDIVLLEWTREIEDALHSLHGGEGTDILKFDARDMDFVAWNYDDETGEPIGAERYTLKRLYFDGFERLFYQGADLTDEENPPERDDVRGLSGDDRLFGNYGNDILRGGKGDDYIDGGIGSDRMYGGEGNDTLVVSEQGEDVFGQQGVDTVLSRVSHSLRAETENLNLLGTADINGSGNELDNVIRGNDGENILTGRDGNDTLDGKGGADNMRGGDGDDTYIVNSSGDQAQETSAAGGIDTVRSSASFTLGEFVENLVQTGTGNIRGTGNSLGNSIAGNSGDNLLQGLGSADLLKGNGGDDAIEGGGGDDRIYGGGGNDELEGGAGRDRFYFTSTPGAFHADTITDFATTDDLIYLARYAFTNLGDNGQLDEDAFRTGSAAADAEDRIIYDATSGNLFYDADGVGGAAQQLFARVDPGLALSNADFIVYG